ncbi:MAG: hypothetical protein K2N54_01475 [Helicobacter sp.]|nr:hypothetical protein [Helicobacter sp.]
MLIKVESKTTWNPKEMFRFAQHDKIPCVIASEQCERGNQRAKNPERAFIDV